MTKLDDLIKEALEDQDQSAIAETHELGYFALGLSQFRGKLGWVTWVIMIVQTLMFLGGVYCAVHFYSATDPVPAIKWGITGAVLLIIGTSLKMSLMPQMQADRVIREVKKLELLLVSRG